MRDHEFPVAVEANNGVCDFRGHLFRRGHGHADTAFVSYRSAGASACCNDGNATRDQGEIEEKLCASQKFRADKPFGPVKKPHLGQMID